MQQEDSEHQPDNARRAVDHHGDQYCEYVCSNGEWSLIGARVSDNDSYYCYCPPEPFPPMGDSDGYRVTVPPSCTPKPSVPQLSEDGVPTFNFAQYGFHDLGNGDFELRLRRANCPEGHFAPPTISKEDLIKHGIVTFPFPIRNYRPGAGEIPWRQA